MDSQALQKSTRNTIALCLDIDGVLVRSKDPLPGALEALTYLQEKKIPFIFLTNSGGVTEAQNLAKLELRLGGTIKFQENQMVQSHTPFRSLLPEYKDKTILVLGGHGDNIRDVAHAYGFRKVLTSSDILAYDENIHPFPEMTQDHHSKYGRKSDEPPKISAIMVWSSPRDWCLDAQVVLDLLLSHQGYLNTRSALNGDPNLPNRGYLQDGQPRLFWANPDLVWATKHSQPRLAQGGFCAALQGIWKAATDGAASDGLWNYAKNDPVQIDAYTCGKPTQETFQFGERALLHHIADNPALTGSHITKIWMIGDSTASDIAGANAFVSGHNIPWGSILVESGIYKAGSDVGEHKPDHIAKNVKEAIEWAVAQDALEQTNTEAETDE